MGRIDRNIKHLEKIFDVIVIGGGIHGIMMTYEASLRNLSVLLLEKDDFGQHTSFNSLRIIHGGFRYLQSLHIKRLIESFKEQRWFLNTFPEYVKPLPCVMPLYGLGLRKPSVAALGVLLHKVLLAWQEKGTERAPALKKGKVVTPDVVKSYFPLVDENGLQGGLVWNDAILEDSQIFIADILKRACENGAVAFNYFKATDVVVDDGQIIGIVALNQSKGEKHLIKGKRIINCAGPWCRDVARRFHKDEVSLFKSMLAWNILFDHDAISEHGVAVTPKNGSRHTYFLVPWKGKLFAGTGHDSWNRKSKDPWPSTKALETFMEDLNNAVPGLNLSARDILYIMPGLQSATRLNGTNLAKKEVIYDHGENGGPKHLYSVSGVKFTTSRLVAEKTLNRIFPDLKANRTKFENAHCNSISRTELLNHLGTNTKSDNALIRTIIEDESVVHLSDLIFRRSTLFEHPEIVSDVLNDLCKCFDWDRARCETEKETVMKLLHRKS